MSARTTLLSALTCTSLLAAAIAPPTGAPTAARAAFAQDGGISARTVLERQIMRAYDEERFDRGLRLTESYLRRWPGNPTILYNAACANARLDRIDEAADRLLQSVRAGFRDFELLERDEDLAALREHDVYRAIVEARRRIERTEGERPSTDAGERENERVERGSPRAPDAGLPTDLVRPRDTRPSERGAPRTNRGTSAFVDWKREFAEQYFYDDDEIHRLHFASPLPERARREMREMIAAQADHMIDELFGSAQRDWVFVLVPRAGERGRFFDSPSTAGWYDHDMRMLVGTDIGATLRHEFAHVLHWGHMDRMGQRHPMWVQEGLASLYEDYDFEPATGRIRFRPNLRHNVVRRLVEAGGAPSWRVLFAMTPERFMDRPGETYPMARSIFEYLAEQELLGDWYRALCESWGRNRDGTVAFERTFGKSLGEVEADWRRWLLARGERDDRIDPGDASLGISAEDAPDGCLVTTIRAGGAAEAAGLQRGDVIIAVGGRPVRSTRELLLAIADRRVGDTVGVRVRRGDETLDVPVRLKAMR